MSMLVVLLTGQAMASMDVSILVVAGPTLRTSLHASGAELQLVLAMYTLTFAALVVTGARLGDVVGRERAFRLGLAGFTASSLMGGLAPTPALLIVARAFQGAAAAVMSPQVLSIIQLQFRGDRRARAIGAYSMILAAGVALGQVLGGLLVGAHLLAAAWRPALLLNAPIGAVLLVAARRRLSSMPPSRQRQLDLRGAAVLAVALLALVAPLTLGRDAGWPDWVWPCFVTFGLLLAGFAALERRIATRAGDPVFDVGVLSLPGVGAGMGTVVVVMACYAGFLVSLDLHLQTGLRFGPLRAGLTFAVYASGFATASLTWTRVTTAVQDRMPIVGPLLMGVSLLVVGRIAASGQWPVFVTALLLFAGGVGHAWAYSPLANRLTEAVRAGQAADLSGLIMTASLVGQIVGVAALAGIYLSMVSHGSGHSLAVMTEVVGMALVVAATCARKSPSASGRQLEGKYEPRQGCQTGRKPATDQ